MGGQGLGEGGGELGAAAAGEARVRGGEGLGDVEAGGVGNSKSAQGGPVGAGQALEPGQEGDEGAVGDGGGDRYAGAVELEIGEGADLAFGQLSESGAVSASCAMMISVARDRALLIRPTLSR